MKSNSQNDGRSFEKSIEIINGQYERQARATISKVEPPVRIIGWGPKQKVIFLENPHVDFVGAWTEQGGRALMFEAKSTTEPTLPAGGKSHLQHTQIEAMKRWRQAGAATWLLWECRGEVRFFTVGMIEAGLKSRRSLVFGDGIMVPAGNGFVFQDFLTTAERYKDYL